MSKGPSPAEVREMLRLLHETYSVLNGMGRSGLSMYDEWPSEASRLYENVGEFLYPEGMPLPHDRWDM